MAEERQELTIHAGIEGAEEAAANLEHVADAQEEVTEQFIAAKPAVDGLAEAKKKLGASGEAYTSVLARIHPSLGAMADMMIKGSQIAGELATQKINLRAVTSKLTDALRANWKALALFASIGGIIAGIAAITAAVRAMKQEWQDATDAIKRHRDELDELKGVEQERQQAIEDISDVRRAGGMTAEQARRAARTAERVAEQFPQIGDAAINQIAGLLGDRLTRDQMAQAAILQQQGRLQLEPTMTVETMMRKLERAMERHGENVERFMERELTQRAEALQEAAKQATATTGATLDLRQRIKEILGTGEDIEAVLEDVLIFGTREALREGLEHKRRFMFGFPGTGRRYEVRTPEPQGWFGLKQTIMTERRILDVERVLETMAQDRVRSSELLRELKTISQDTKQPRTNSYHNCHFAYPDSHTQQRETRNGQNYRVRIGEG